MYRLDPLTRRAGAIPLQQCGAIHLLDIIACREVRDFLMLSLALARSTSVNTTGADNTLLPATTYGQDNRQVDTSDTVDDSILLPFALDPNTAPGPSPLGRPISRYNERAMGSSPATGDGKSGRDYFNRPPADHREALKENNSRSASKERRPPPSPSPHIAFQEKGRQQSETLVDTLKKRKEGANESPSLESRSRSQHASPARSSTTDAFKLQEVPKGKKAETKRRDSESQTPPPQPQPQLLQQERYSSPPVDMSARLSRPLMEPPTFSSSPPPGPQGSPETPSSSISSNQRSGRPARGESLNLSASRHSTYSSKTDRPIPSPTTPTLSHPERKSTSGAPSAQQSSGMGITSPIDSPPSKTMSDVPVPPARSAGRLPPQSAATFTSPRAPPPPPPPSASQVHKNSESTSSMSSEARREVYSPGGLPRYSHQGDFSMDEDFARLLGTEDKDEKEAGVFRRVSNAVSKHGRSFSDRGSITSRGHKKWPTNGSIEISSPTVASPDTREESVNLRNELRRAQQRIAELEAEKNGLQEHMHSATDIRQANTILKEKRNTMAVLDTQREMVIRELEIMTEHLKRAKDSNGSMDINQLKSDILKDFANSLHKLKIQLAGQIEDLITKRVELTDEISNLIQMKDKGFQEYESLSAANARLSATNRELVDSIQKTFQNNKKTAPALDQSINGLGIYNAQKGGKSDISIDAACASHDHAFGHIHDADSEAQLAQPQVVNIRKTGKPTKFSTWKKGGQAITKNVTKGFKGAFGSEQKQEDYNIKVIGTPYGSTHTQPDLVSMASSMKSKESDQGTPKGWFSQKPGAKPPGQQDRFKPAQNTNSSTNLVADAKTVLFGSDLTARCEFEKQMIPRIVSRCIEEVELRGMDVEGIYRKSGGTSQVNQVRGGFETDNEHDISDPDLDIHSVTSALKNYFRRLPVPLITFDVYDQFLEAGRKYTVNTGIAAPANDLSEIEDLEVKSKALIAAINEIPKAHRDTLQFLVFHLSRVIQHANENLVGDNLIRDTCKNLTRLLDDSSQLGCCLRANYHATDGYSTRAHGCSATTRCRAIASRKLQNDFQRRLDEHDLWQPVSYALTR